MRMVTHVKPLVAHIVRIPTDESLPLQYWAIDGLPQVDGKRQRKFFRTKDAAERELATVKKKLRKEGEKALLIPDRLRIEALDCRDRLKPYRLGSFNATFDPRLISELSVHEIEGWLHGLEQSPKSLNNFHTAVSALFSFAVKRSYASSNPLDAIDKVRVPAKAPGIISPPQSTKRTGRQIGGDHDTLLESLQQRSEVVFTG